LWKSGGGSFFLQTPQGVKPLTNVWNTFWKWESKRVTVSVFFSHLWICVGSETFYISNTTTLHIYLTLSQATASGTEDPQKNFPNVRPLPHFLCPKLFKQDRRMVNIFPQRSALWLRTYMVGCMWGCLSHTFSLSFNYLQNKLTLFLH